MWKEIPGYEGFYSVNKRGEVLSHAGKSQGGNNILSKEKLLKANKDKGGYEYVVFCVNKKRKTLKIHRIVATAFIPNPENKPCVNHINGVKNDNRIENLEWNTYSENTIHSYKALGQKPSKHNEKKVNQLTMQNEHIATFTSLSEAARALNISSSAIRHAVLKGGRRIANGYRWEYAQ